MNHKKLLVALLTAFVYFPANAIITQLSGSEEALKKIEQTGKPFPSDRFGRRQAPNLSSIQRNNCTFIAKMDSFGMNRYFQFQTQDEANQIQKSCDDGNGSSVTWYYIDPSTAPLTITTPIMPKRNSQNTAFIPHKALSNTYSKPKLVIATVTTACLVGLSCYWLWKRNK